MTAPDWWAVVLITLAAWRTFHLLAHDDILDRPRRYVTRLSPKWKQEGDATGPDYREGLAKFIQCPFCMGFYCALAWSVAYWVWADMPVNVLWVALPLAVNAGLIGAQRVLSSE